MAVIGLLGALAVRVLDTPSRPYNAEANTVGNEYDSWTEVTKYDKAGVVEKIRDVCFRRGVEEGPMDGCGTPLKCSQET